MTCRGVVYNRACLGCGRPFEDWSHPLEEGAYIGCMHCAHLYVVTEDGLDRVLLGTAPGELRMVFEELLDAHWSSHVAALEAA